MYCWYSYLLALYIGICDPLTHCVYTYYCRAPDRQVQLYILGTALKHYSYLFYLAQRKSYKCYFCTTLKQLLFKETIIVCLDGWISEWMGD